MIKKFLFIPLILAINSVFAANNTIDLFNSNFNPLGNKVTPLTLAGSFLTGVTAITLVAAPIAIIGAGMTILQSGGNVEATKNARKVIIWAVAGFIVVLLARVLVYAIQGILS